MNSKLNTIIELYGSNAIRKDGSFNIGYLINPKIKRDTKGIQDINQLENSRLLDKSYKYERAYEFLMEVIPDVNDGSLKMLAKYNYKNHLNGGQKAVIASML